MEYCDRLEWLFFSSATHSLYGLFLFGIAAMYIKINRKPFKLYLFSFTLFSLSLLNVTFVVVWALMLVLEVISIYWFDTLVAYGNAVFIASFLTYQGTLTWLLYDIMKSYVNYLNQSKAKHDSDEKTKD